ncbi:MAG: NAD(P)/FAD-dependent oxidoreductase [Burkholderiaceae bacterium]
MARHFDAIVIGAGAAGMFCAAQAGRGGLRVALLDHWPRLAEKIRISGGGRCNFTNLEADRPERFVGEDPAFARNALRAFPPRRFIERVSARGIGWHEKHRGQLFCDQSAEEIIAMLRDDCDAAGVRWLRPVRVASVEPAPGAGAGTDAGAGAGFVVASPETGELHAPRVVIATGGMAIPKAGATDFGLRIARRFGMRIVEPRPALVPLVFGAAGSWPWSELAGMAMPVVVRAPRSSSAPAFHEDLLFTHRGLSGPAILQISTFWKPGEPLAIDLLPDDDLAARLLAAKRSSRQQLAGALAGLIPKRLATRWLADERFAPLAGRRLAELADRDLTGLAAALRDWQVQPSGTEGFRKAEVMAGGVATETLDPRTLESRRAPGLYFIGEVVDVTGWLGGYNFQWAWASAFLAAQAMVRRAGSSLG